MSTTVYKARVDEAELVVVDWRLAETLEALEALLADGWYPTQDEALTAFWVVADKPVTIGTVTLPDVAGDVEPPQKAKPLKPPTSKHDSHKKK